MIEQGSPRTRLVARNRKRLTQAQQYGRRHRLTRRRIASFVAAGFARCARGAGCLRAELVDGQLVGGLILPGEPWDLGHDDKRPWLHSGPEHASCNRGAPHRNRTSREW